MHVLPTDHPAPCEVHLWHLPLDLPPEASHHLQRLLDDQERKRGTRLRDRGAAARFMTCRGQLREVLAAYCRVSPETIRFTYGPYGKPSLANDPLLRFNVAHSGNLAVIAVAHGVETGVDIELIDPDFPFTEAAQQFFSSPECEQLAALPAEMRLTAFYTCWTRKEAYLKACGAGFSLPSDCFDMVVSPDRAPRMIRHRLQPNEIERWTFADLSLPLGFRGAVALEGETVAIRGFTSTRLNAPEGPHIQ